MLEFIQRGDLGDELVTGGAFTQVAGAAVTLANMRLSAVDGTAFVDFSAADVLTDHIGKILTVKDSAGKVLVGYIKAAGTGETTNEELTNTGFETGDPPTGWLTQGTPTLSQATDERTGGAGTKSINVAAVAAYDAARQALVADKRLYKYGVWVKAAASYEGAIGIYGITNHTSSNTSWVYLGPFYRTNVLYTNGLTLAGTTIGSSARFDDVTCAQVLTPSATGVTIVSTSGGATYNWTYQEAGFNYHDSSNYTYEIYDTDWLYGTGWYPSSNKAVKVAGTASNLTQSSAKVVATKRHRMSETVVRAAGTLTPELGSVDGTVISLSGAYIDYPVAVDDDYLKFKADSLFAGSIDLASAKLYRTWPIKTQLGRVINLP